jgi:cytochrome c-type biogenesis protein
MTVFGVNALQGSAAAKLLGAMILGLTSGLSPCGLPALALVVSYAARARGRNRVITGALVLLGFCGAMVLLGMAASWGGSFVGNTRILSYAAGIITLFMGAVAAGLVPLHLSATLPLGALTRSGSVSGLWSTVLLGVLLALVASPCATPVTISLLAVAASEASPAYGARLLLAYALGRSFTYIAGAVFVDRLSTNARLERLGSTVQKASGYLMVLVGLYILWIA